MTFSSLNLGYKIRRAEFSACHALEVFEHDLDAFCIPIDQADLLATAYKKYMAGAGILDRNSLTSGERTQAESDRYFLEMYHERENLTFKTGQFELSAVIDFVWFEAKVSTETAMRWCMMMEYIIWKRQKSNDDSTNPSKNHILLRMQ